MTNMNLTPELVIDQLALIAEEAKAANGGEDFVYLHRTGTFPSCTYVRDGAPDCIVARWAHRFGGADLATLAGWDADLGDSSVGCLEDAGQLPSEWTPGTVEILKTVQCSQDSGVAWSEAVAAAARKARDLSTKLA